MSASTIVKRARRSAGISASRRTGKARRHFRLRKKVVGTEVRPRLVVTRSARHLFVQVVDDGKGVRYQGEVIRRKAGKAGKK